MKIMLLQHYSDYGWIGNFIFNLRDALKKAGHETYVYNLINEEDSFYSAINKFQPDFTLSVNDSVQILTDIYDKKVPQYEVVDIPHVSYFIDHPYDFFWVRNIMNPKHKNLLVLNTEFEDVFIDEQISNHKLVNHSASSALSEYELGSDKREIEVLFAGRVRNPDSIIDEVSKSTVLDELSKKMILEFLKHSTKYIIENNKILPYSPKKLFIQFLEDNNVKIPDENRRKLIFNLTSVADSYYKSLVRLNLMTKLADSGIKIHLFSNDFYHIYPDHENITKMVSVSYYEFAELHGQAMFALNISPLNFRMNDRIALSMMAGAIPITTPIPEIYNEIPEMNNSTIELNWENADEIKKKIDEYKENPELYMAAQKANRDTALKHFSWENTAEKIIEEVTNRF